MTAVSVRLTDLGHQVTTAVVEVIGPDLEVRHAHLDTENPMVVLDVDNGQHLVRAHFSDGGIDSRVMSLTADGDHWDLTPPTPELPDPTYDDQPQLGGAETAYLDFDADGQRIIRWAPTRSSRAGAGEESRQIVAAYPLRLWRMSYGSWDQLPIGEPARAVDGGLEIELSVDNALHLLEVGFEDVSQFVSLPAEQSLVSVCADPAGQLTLDARTTDPGVEALRGYLDGGEIAVARGLAPGVAGERFLMNKMAAPRIAALGGYALLRLGELDRLHNWADNLTNWMDWLPDGPVIAAWQRLRSQDPTSDHPTFDAAMQEVLELLQLAVSRGAPVYTEGVRLLKEGLELFATDDIDWHVEDALRHVNSYAAAMVWGKSATTYYGSAPGVPLARSHGTVAPVASPATASDVEALVTR